MSSHQSIDEQGGLNDLEVENTEGAQSNQAQFVVFEGYRIPGSPFQIGEGLQVDEIDFGPQRAFHSPRQAGDLRQYGNVECFQRVSPGTEDTYHFAFVKKYSRLALAYDKLGAEFDVT